MTSSNEKELIIDVTTLLKWNRSPVGIIRTQLEFVHYTLANDLSAKYFKFNDSKDNLIEVTSDEIKQQVTNLLNFKNTPNPSRYPKEEKRTNIFFDFRLLKKVKHIYKTEGLKAVLRKICKRFCPKAFKEKLKLLLIRFSAHADIVPNDVLITQDPISSTLFSPEIVISASLNINFISKNSILISMGLDWDHSNYALLYWLKQRIGFQFIGSFYDSIPVTSPELVQSEYFSKMFFSHIYYLIHLSDKIFCISDFSKKQLEEICEQHNIKDIPLLQTIHLGDSVYKEVINKKFNKRNHKKSYVLYVSTIEARKNHILLLKVWQELKKQNILNLPDLVLVGMYGWGVENLQELYKNDKSLQDVVHFYDDVDDDELVSIYQKSKFTVFPSFVEGWGLGAVESMLYGKVCLISSCDALQEATQGLMPSLDPKNTDAWVEMIKKMISDKKIIEHYTQEITDKFKSRSWKEFSSDFTTFAKDEL